MRKSIPVILFFILSFGAAASEAMASSKKLCDPCNQSSYLNSVVNEINKACSNLRSYTCDLEYLVEQPLFDSSTKRTGKLYYQKNKNSSDLRINFDSLQQDDEKSQKYGDEYIFDGIWLVHLDYRLKTDTRRQMAEPNDHADVLELLRQNFPIVGFSENQNLQKQFKLTIIDPERTDPSGAVHIQMEVKKDSDYSDQYKLIDCWFDEKDHLPVRIVAVNNDDDNYIFNFSDRRINKKIKTKTFEIKVPKDFDKPKIVPLKKERTENG